MLLRDLTTLQCRFGRLVLPLLIVLSFAFPLMLTACQKAVDSPPASEALTAQEESPVSTDHIEALYGGRAVIGVTQEPDFLDPHLAVAAGTKEILFNIFEGLVRLGSEGELLPALATSWQVEDEGRALRFQLREGVLFHNGQKLTPEDVKYSLERAAGLADNPLLVPELAGIRAVDIVEETGEVIVKQESADADLLSYLTTPIIPAAYTEQASKPLGTGPFCFSSYTPQVSLELRRFEQYWDESKPYLAELCFRIYSDMDAAYPELLAGAIDIFPYLTEEKTHGLEDQYNIVAGGANMVQLLAFNNERPPLDQRLVREAVNLAIDREQVVDLTMGKYGKPLFSGMAPSMGAYYHEQAAGLLNGDQENARAKLAEAGYADGLELVATVPGNYLIHVDTANILAAQLAEVGIKLTLETVEWGTWLERVYAGRDYQMTVIALTYDYYTPSDVLNRYTSSASENFINFHHARYDEIAAQAIYEQDHEARIAQYHELQDILFTETASAFLQEPWNITVVRKPLAGYIQYPAYIQDLSSVYYTNQEALDASLEK